MKCQDLLVQSLPHVTETFKRAKCQTEDTHFLPATHRHGEILEALQNGEIGKLGSNLKITISKGANPN